MTMSIPFHQLRRREYSTIPVPISPRMRVASIKNTSIKTGDFRYFHSGDRRALELFAPQLLIGGADEIHKLACLMDHRAIDLGSVDVILVTTELGAPPLCDTQRVVLWQAFGAPIYEVLTSASGDLIACECEAHSGWHVEPDTRAHWKRNLVGMHLETAVCECGRRQPRLVEDPAERLTISLAATA